MFNLSFRIIFNLKFKKLLRHQSEPGLQYYLANMGITSILTSLRLLCEDFCENVIHTYARWFFRF